MLAIVRFVIMGGLALGVIYASLWFYLRARRRDLLIEQARTEGALSSEAYVIKQMPAYDKKRRRVLGIVVGLLPLAAFAAIYYAIQVN